MAVATLLIFSAVSSAYADEELSTENRARLQRLMSVNMAVVEALQEITERRSELIEESKIDISGFSPKLDSYMSFATGQELTPKLISLSGTYYAEPDDENNEYSDDEDEAASSSGDSPQTGQQVSVSLAPEDCEIKYYRVISFSEEQLEEVKAISEVGEYRIAVTVKDSEHYRGEASCLFSVIGLQQHLTVEKTKYEATVGEDIASISARTDGDASGFVYESSDEAMLEVSRDGKPSLKAPGKAKLYVYTKGDKLYQPARVSISFEIRPKKVSGISVKTNAETRSAALAWRAQDGVSKYEISYSTSKSFKLSEKASQKRQLLKTVTRKGTSTKAVIKGLSSDKVYYIRIRAVTEHTDSRGNKSLIKGKWSSVKKIVGA